MARPKIRFRSNVSGLNAAIAQYDRTRPVALRVAARALGEEFCKYMIDSAPRDTNRYLRGWLLAARQAGILIPTPGLNVSSRRDRFIAQLQRQLAVRERRLKNLLFQKRVWYDQKPERSKDGYYTQYLVPEIPKVEKSIKQAQRILKQASGSDHFIFIPSRLDATRVTDTVRTRIYGGEGRLVQDEHSVRVDMRNLEIHARFLERKHMLAKRAEDWVQTVADQVIRKKYIERTIKRAGAA